MAREKWAAFQLMEWIEFEPGHSIIERRAVSRCFGYPRTQNTGDCSIPLGDTQNTKTELIRRLGQVTLHQNLICRGPKIIVCKRNKSIIQS